MQPAPRAQERGCVSFGEKPLKKLPDSQVIDTLFCKAGGFVATRSPAFFLLLRKQQGKWAEWAGKLFFAAIVAKVRTGTGLRCEAMVECLSPLRKVVEGVVF